jgi:16S rRNA (cytidine1402-2'-O)-methyltransferase
MTYLPDARYTDCMGHLYIVATPIGNLGDITYRAVETLRNSRALFCEDTRQSRKLLSHLGISVPTYSCRGQNSDACIPRVLQFLEDSADISYLSDAGTPGISDPGSRLVRAVREAGYPVVPIPGASAVTALLSVSGVAGRGWFFEGFLPPKGAKRARRIGELAVRGEPFVLYESPHRIEKLVDEISRAAAGYHVLLGRELTKLHEQVVGGTIEDIKEKISNGDIPVRGEFVLLVWTGKSR